MPVQSNARLARKVLQVLPEMQVKTDWPEPQEDLVVAALIMKDHNRLARNAHQDRLDYPDTKVLEVPAEIRAIKARLEPQAVMDYQERKAPRVSSAYQAIREGLDREDTRVRTESATQKVLRDPREKSVKPDLLVKKDCRAREEMTQAQDHKDRPDHKDLRVRKERMESLDCRDQVDSQVPTLSIAHVLSVRRKREVPTLHALPPHRLHPHHVLHHHHVLHLHLLQNNIRQQQVDTSHSPTAMQHTQNWLTLRHFVVAKFEVILKFFATIKI